MNELLDVQLQQIKNAHWSFFGNFMQQTPEAVLSLNRLLNAHNFDTIIELGTHDAGLSMLFALYSLNSRIRCECDNPMEPVLYKNNTHHKSLKTFYTFDNTIRDKGSIFLLQNMGTIFEKRDILNDQPSIDYIGSIIKNGGRVLLMCDNGNKVKEFNIYSKFLKPNDFIMAHDYGKDEESFKKIKENNIWFTQETKWDDIRESCEKHGIIPIYQEEFDKSVWFCGVKK